MICEVADTHGSVAKERVVREFTWSRATFKMDAKGGKNYGKNCVKNQIGFLRS